MSHFVSVSTITELITSSARRVEAEKNRLIDKQNQSGSGSQSVTQPTADRVPRRFLNALINRGADSPLHYFVNELNIIIKNLVVYVDEFLLIILKIAVRKRLSMKNFTK